MHRKILISCAVLLSVSIGYGDSAVTAKTEKKNWNESGVFELSLVSSKQRLRAKMKRLGYQEKQEIFLDKKKTHSIILWEKGKEQLIYMLWRIEVDRTGYSFRRTEDASKR